MVDCRHDACASAWAKRTASSTFRSTRGVFPVVVSAPRFRPAIDAEANGLRQLPASGVNFKMFGGLPRSRSNAVRSPASRRI
jgi:hypothetical protein